jgi:hypothetical protein
VVKKTSLLVKIAFPLGLIGAILKSYTLKEAGDTTFGTVGILAGILIGSVTAVCLIGFLIFVNFKLFAIPQDLFTGAMLGKTGPIFGGNPAIFRQAVVAVFCFVGAGIGFIFSAPIFGVDTFGIGISLLIPGIAGSVLLVGLWKRKWGQA